MSARRVRRGQPSAITLPPLLYRLADAARCDDDVQSAAVLAAFGQLALVTIPTRGVLAPADQEDLYRAIEVIARDRLGLQRARGEVKRALNLVTEFSERDAIETAYTGLREVSERPYFYAGLAFGVVFRASPMRLGAELPSDGRIKSEDRASMLRRAGSHVRRIVQRRSRSPAHG